MLVPKEMQIEHKGGIKAMTDEQIEAAIEMIQGMLAAREGHGPRARGMITRIRPMKPASADILAAIAKAELGDWIDPTVVPVRWHCDLYDADGQRVGDGDGHTATEAMALAWLCVWAPDALINARVEPGAVPYDIPDGWRFELAPPWQSKPDCVRRGAVRRRLSAGLGSCAGNLPLAEHCQKIGGRQMSDLID
jgi:hypothetical protein